MGHMMSAGTVNALDKIDYALFVSNCPGFVCLSRVRAVMDTLDYKFYIFEN